MEAPDSNIDKFNDLAGRILGELYSVFPCPARLVPGNFYDFGCQSPDEVLSSDNYLFFVSTVEWLISNGYIAASREQVWFSRAVLTEKALETMNQIPESLDPNETRSRGQMLVDAVKSGNTLVWKAVFSEIISAGVKISLRHVTGLDI
ncbi:hypothetical protein AXA88_15535 [Salmonella enterica]|nr:hypothetical protein [Salmonella enterica]EAX3607314.1 hypothetical protein [Salmonella enterica]EGW6279326.1 hypothetical protein [Salmonella enterica]EGX3931514.1 hypothetical protein [Salmonella enterica]